MSYIETSPMQHSTILRVYSDKDTLNVDPEYQRMGDVWSIYKKQLLIDSILNNYDIPKMYFHQLSREERNESGFSYSVIDGRQRLEAIWGFLDGNFRLSKDILYLDDPSIDLTEKTYEEIAISYPKIKIKFDSYVLPIINVVTDDVDLIEEMFSRLNEAVPLNSPEKRNAIGGALVKCIRELSNHEFFTQKVSFSNKRYQHYEVLARILLIESHLIFNEKLVDTKKEFLDKLAFSYKNEETKVTAMKEVIAQVLDKLSAIFVEKDSLLRSQGNIVVYYLLAKSDSEEPSQFTRIKLEAFLERVKENKDFASKALEEEYEKIDYELIQYSKLLVQGTNDIGNIRYRLKTLSKFMNIDPINLNN
ncbi:hypothetical protein F900_03370 [Acinetobacter modestus]|uniref:GmrSD restriction endonucleases N-terminal domain-containing protein n=1 Tax=Acinetobacter modestus TaxID=1776740 RepID=N9LQB4_9GAMM|nr:DUF262 domain-containing protein [Acinetobacter modestus]ENW98413.1 hypothetical protein F900_03370 [Acinetobacter modestus]